MNACGGPWWCASTHKHRPAHSYRVGKADEVVVSILQAPGVESPMVRLRHLGDGRHAATDALVPLDVARDLRPILSRLGHRDLAMVIEDAADTATLDSEPEEWGEL